VRYVVLTARTPQALDERANAWLAAERLHARHHSITSHGGQLVMVIAVDDTPEPTDAAEKWIGQQLDDRKVL
jgi:hypothetical protein